LFILLKNLSQPPLCYSEKTLAKVDLRARERKRQREGEKPSAYIIALFWEKLQTLESFINISQSGLTN